MTAVDFHIVLPEVLLAIFAMLALLGAVYTGKDSATGLITWATAALFVALAVFIATRGEGSNVAFGGLFTDDAFSRFAKVVVLISAAAVLVMAQDYMSRRNMARFEYPILIALSVIGMMVMVSAGDLIALYMGLELQSLALYVVASMQRNSLKSSEAGLKYFVLGSLSSGLLLYGASLVYGYAGTTEFAGILSVLGDKAPLGLLFGLVFVLTGMAFKVSAVPFHMWTPDVYEGSPTPVTAFFATAPKVAAMSLIARVIYDAFGGVVGEWSQILAALSVLSMFLGAIAGIAQRDIKRLMAYSSISHMGFALMGLASGTAEGVQSMLIYMAIYVSMNIGVFAFILSIERNGQPASDIASFNMLSKREPLKALGMLVLLFSLAGVPPMLGFFGKFYVLKAAYDAGMGWLALAGVIASVIGAFYYLRIVYYMYFGEKTEGVANPMSPVLWVMFVAASAVMLLGVINLFGIEAPALAAAQALVG